MAVAERAKFAGAVVVRNGLEGTLACYLNRPYKVFCSARQGNGNYLRHEFEVTTQEILGIEVAVDEKIDTPNAEENAKLIGLFTKNLRTSNQLFDYRVKVTCAGLQAALTWIKKNLPN